MFWALVQQGGETTTQAHATLRVRSLAYYFSYAHGHSHRHAQGTVSKAKHEILFSRFGVNYNNIDVRFRKGSVLIREQVRNL